MKTSIWIKGVAATGAFAWCSVGCGTLGAPTSAAEGFPHGGVGIFREMCAAETNLPTLPPEALYFPAGSAGSVDGAMLVRDTAGYNMFFAAGAYVAPPRTDGGTDGGGDVGTPSDAGRADTGVLDAGGGDAGSPFARRVNWNNYGPRQIYRSDLGSFDQFGGTTQGSSVVLMPSIAWEGGYVTEPWVVQNGSQVFLYYASAGGIGVATASSLAGPYQKQTTPIFAGGRHPSVLSLAGTTGLGTSTYVMFFEFADRVVMATSTDGLHFGPPTDVPLLAVPGRDSREGSEIGRGAPGAALLKTQADRWMIRIYYESRRSTGVTLIAFAGTANGTDFDVLPRAVNDFPRDSLGSLYSPAPLLVNDHATALYAISVNAAGRGVLVGLVAPKATALTSMGCL